MLFKFSLRAGTTIYGIHAYGYLVLGYFITIYLHMPMSCVLYESSYPCNARSSIPMPTVSRILLFHTVTTAFFILLLFLFH